MIIWIVTEIIDVAIVVRDINGEFVVTRVRWFMGCFRADKREAIGFHEVLSWIIFLFDYKIVFNALWSPPKFSSEMRLSLLVVKLYFQNLFYFLLLYYQCCGTYMVGLLEIFLVLIVHLFGCTSISCGSFFDISYFSTIIFNVYIYMILFGV